MSMYRNPEGMTAKELAEELCRECRNQPERKQLSVWDFLDNDTVNVSKRK